ncbi:MAG: HAD hydrolase-like protein [Candidatus Saccharimonadales bacterium]
MIIVSKNIRTVLWDLDGTLLNSMAVFEEVLAEILPEFNLAVPSHKVVSKNFHGNLQESMAVMLGLRAEELRPIIDKFLSVQNNHYEVIDHHLCPDAVGLAKRFHLAGMRQILVTNREHTGRLQASPRSIVANSELTKYIDTVICGDDSEHRKPKPEVLGDLFTNGDFVPESTMVIGDQFVDGEFALSLGVKAILVSRQETGEILHAERLVGNWRSTIEVVRTLEDVQVA